MLHAAMLTLLVVTQEPDRSALVERFFTAIQKDDLPAVESLLQADPSLVAERRNGRSPLIAAAFLMKGSGFVQPAKNPVLRAVRNVSRDLDLFDAAVVGDVPGIRSALSRDSSKVNAMTDFGWTPLHLAAFSGNVDAVRLLIERGADINSRARSRFRNTPLQAALLVANIDAARVLLEHGADPLVRQAEGFTPMHEAALIGSRELIDLLMAHGAEAEARANDGRSPYSEAMRGGHREIAEYLVSKGAKRTEGAELMKSPD